MISTGFKALDAAIGGLKKGKLYGLATFNFDHVAAEYFALNMIANLHAPAFFHSSIKAPERWADAALAGNNSRLRRKRLYHRNVSKAGGEIPDSGDSDSLLS